MRRTAGWAISSSTTSAASAGSLTTRLTTPGGKPASVSAEAIAACVRGHSSDALSTTVLPYASGMATARAPRMTGAFQGAIAGHHARRRAEAHRQHARHVGGDDFADRAVGLGGRLAQHSGGQRDVEHAPAERPARLGGHERRDRLGPLLEQRGRRVEQRPPPRGSAGRPRRERRRGGLDGPPRVLARRPRRPRSRARLRAARSSAQTRPDPAGTHSPPISSCCCSSACTVAIGSPPP